MQAVLHSVPAGNRRIDRQALPGAGGRRYGRVGIPIREIRRRARRSRCTVRNYPVRNAAGPGHPDPEFPSGPDDRGTSRCGAHHHRNSLASIRTTRPELRPDALGVAGSIHARVNGGINPANLDP